METLISIIVPIYNVADYLPKCIESICNQTYQHLEIILVDDGSTDDSLSICNSYARKDSRIIVIHKENGGITTARKVGLEASHGDVATFVDGDDWIEIKMYEELLRLKEDACADFVLSGAYRDNDKGTYVKWNASEWGEGLYCGERLEFVKKNLFRETKCTINGACWNKLFDRDLLEYGLCKIDDRVCGIEDDMFVYHCFLKARRVLLTNKAYYHAYERLSSATHSKHSDFLLMMHKVLPNYMELVEQVSDIGFKTECYRFLINKLISGIEHVLPDVTVERYYLPVDLIGSGKKRVVLYGAGVVGRDYYRQLKEMDSVDVVLWVDKTVRKMAEYEMDIMPVERIIDSVYDLILIAVYEGSIAKQIRDYLISIGVNEDCILWQQPDSLREKIRIEIN